LGGGGSSEVRAYPSGESSGYAGYKYSIDAKYNIAQNYLSTFSNLNASVFYDYGKCTCKTF